MDRTPESQAIGELASAISSGLSDLGIDGLTTRNEVGSVINLVDAMVRIADAISELADAVRSID